MFTAVRKSRHLFGTLRRNHWEMYPASESLGNVTVELFRPWLPNLRIPQQAVQVEEPPPSSTHHHSRLFIRQSCVVEARSWDARWGSPSCCAWYPAAIVVFRNRPAGWRINKEEGEDVNGHPSARRHGKSQLLSRSIVDAGGAEPMQEASQSPVQIDAMEGKIANRNVEPYADLAVRTRSVEECIV